MSAPVNPVKQQNKSKSNTSDSKFAQPKSWLHHQKDPLFIAVEGPIGVGKTTLTKLLTEKLQASCLKEIIEENPYLEKFYENVEEYAFQTEMFFLCNRIKQLEDAQKKKLEQGDSVVADYSIVKNLIFAGLTLQPHHFEKYKQVFEILTKDLPQPEVIIYLHGDVDLLMKRIALRDRPFERNMSRDYMEKLSEAYDRYFFHGASKTLFNHIPPDIIPINIRDRDFINQPADVDFIIEKVLETMSQRRNKQC
ncbi:deoxynucleoside kinase [Isachenkonia alkalipeptolytica]|uniref:Deoxynucleoside kinase n=1 Tax=Isachenkonia alkalipeptolytica TaxID=2565777 RepID=A0AA43XMZ1_9CLOT|nr:deoxynucleoside kinase [Isachenkonia alkalipeptolytica]NBG89431.1 deoxynucleoside kinase [Isachenkonia alkalipeptolytica]